MSIKNQEPRSKGVQTRLPEAALVAYCLILDSSFLILPEGKGLPR